MADIIPIGGETRAVPHKDPDAHGQAALMLAESILHALVEAQTITIHGALSIIQTAQDTKVEVGKEARENSTTIADSLHLLGRIATSFEADLN